MERELGLGDAQETNLGRDLGCEVSSNTFASPAVEVMAALAAASHSCRPFSAGVVVGRHAIGAREPLGTHLTSRFGSAQRFRAGGDRRG